jgi:hypothetical protein
MRTLASIIALFFVTAFALSGCGGDSGCGHVTGGGSAGVSGCNGTNTNNKIPATVTVVTSATTIPPDGTTTATITASVADGTGAGVSGATVTFSATGGKLSATTGTTDSTGKATVTLTSGATAPGTTITVTAGAGTVTGTTSVAVSAAQQSITLATSSPTLASDNSVPVTITAIVKDANNNLVKGATVNFTATSGGLTANNGGVTDVNGTATATLSVAADPSLRIITVTGTSNGANATISVNVVGTSLTLGGPSSLVQGTPADYNINLTDFGNKGIPGKTVTIASSAGNTITVKSAPATSVVTDSSGHATFTVTATKTTPDTLTVTALGASAALTVNVSTLQFSITAPPPAVLPATTNIPIAASPCTPNVPVSVSFTNAGAPIADGTTVNFTSTRGTLSAQSAPTTGGVATVMVCATTAGPATLSASAIPPGGTLANTLTASEVVYFVSTNPNALNLQASPQTIAINGQSTFTAVVRDAAGNLVQGQAVDFTLTDTTGGSLSVAESITDVEGTATTVYTAGQVASSAGGVTVLAKLKNNAAISNTATLTVNGAALHITFGTGQKIRENANQTAFLQDYFVAVVDSAGASVPNKQVTLTLHSASRPHNAYFKGQYAACNGAWVQTDGINGCGSAPTACLNEDINLTGVYDPAEDVNKDGVLQPGDIAIVTTDPVTTGTDGTANFTIQWPEDHSLWVQVDLTAKASVSGTESSSTITFVLPILASYLNNVQSSPPGFKSPYGIGLCTDKP